MELHKPMVVDSDGNLNVKIDKIRARYSFPPFIPTTAGADDFIEVPVGYVFYMDKIEVENTDAATAHTFQVKDNAGNIISVNYPVNANEVKTIDFYHQGLEGKIFFVPDTYNTLKFKPSGYLVKK